MGFMGRMGLKDAKNIQPILDTSDTESPWDSLQLLRELLDKFLALAHSLLDVDGVVTEHPVHIHRSSTISAKEGEDLDVVARRRRDFLISKTDRNDRVRGCGVRKGTDPAYHALVESADPARGQALRLGCENYVHGRGGGVLDRVNLLAPSPIELSALVDFRNDDYYDWSFGDPELLKAGIGDLLSLRFFCDDYEFPGWRLPALGAARPASRIGPSFCMGIGISANLRMLRRVKMASITSIGIAFPDFGI